MDDEQSYPIEDAGAAATEAEQPSSQGGTEEGGASSAPAEEDTLTAADAMVEGFLKEYGEETDDAPKEPEASEETEAGPEEESDPERDQSPDEKVRLTPEEYNALPTKAKQRIGYLSAEAKRAKAELETLSTQVEDYREGHEAISKLREFSRENNLRSEDVTNGLHIMARLQKGDFEGFLSEVMPFVSMAQQATGKALDPEIQQLVDDGEITEVAARRMTQAEIRSKLAQQELQRERESRTARETQDQRGRALQSMQRAVAETEASLRASDPDYALKSQAIQAQFEMMLKHGAIPKSPEAAAQMVREIHQTVQVPRPQLRPTPPRPNATTGNRRSAPPTSPREAVMAALTEGNV